MSWDSGLAIPTTAFSCQYNTDMNIFVPDTKEDDVTDTVIVTSHTRAVCEEPLFQDIIRKVQEVVDTRGIYGENAVRVTCLAGFKRILITSPDHDTSRAIKSLNVQFLDCKFGFSLTDHVIRNADNKWDSTSSVLASDPSLPVSLAKTYLKVPASQTLFLVSPPASPPSEFDYSRLEEWPNNHTGHGYVHPTSEDKPHTTQVFDNGQMKIVVDSLGSGTSDSASASPNIVNIKTAMPPTSTFDDV